MVGTEMLECKANGKWADSQGNSAIPKCQGKSLVIHQMERIMFTIWNQKESFSPWLSLALDIIL